METDKLVMLFESPDPINCRVAFQLMEGLETEQIQFSETVLRAAALSLQTLLQEEQRNDDFYEDTTTKEEIWNWVSCFHLTLAEAPKLLEWIVDDPEKCLYHDLKETFPLIKSFSVDTHLPAFPIERIFECANLELLEFKHITIPLTSLTIPGDLIHLKKIWFYYCQAEPGFYSDLLAKSTHLTSLQFTNSNVSWFPHETLQMHDLEQFVFLGDEAFSQEPIRIPDEIEQLQKLSDFCFSYIPLVEFPQAVTKLTNLASLVLKYNQCHFQIPDSMQNLTKLESILLNGNYFEEFPEAITRISSLKTVQIGKGIKHISPAISQMHQLTRLFLLGVDFEELPESLSTIENLHTLWVSGNLRSPVGIDTYAKLTQLNLSSCKIRELPSSLFNAQQLEELNLSYNNLTEIPQQIQAFTNLKKLELKNNQITQLPDELYELPSLEWLSLTGNPLTQLHPHLSKLKKLTTLDLLHMTLAAEHVDIVRGWLPKAQVMLNQTYYPPLEKSR